DPTYGGSVGRGAEPQLPVVVGGDPEGVTAALGRNEVAPHSRSIILGAVVDALEGGHLEFGAGIDRPAGIGGQSADELARADVVIESVTDRAGLEGDGIGKDIDADITGAAEGVADNIVVHGDGEVVGALSCSGQIARDSDHAGSINRKRATGIAADDAVTKDFIEIRI